MLDPVAIDDTQKRHEITSDNGEIRARIDPSTEPV
jgi:hypothetical protein